MTKHELSKLIYLNRGTEYLKSKIEELACAAESSQVRITGMPRAINLSGRVGSYAAEIAELKELLEENLGKCFKELSRLKGFINDIEGSEIRMIMTLRYVNGLSWRGIAARISINATKDSIRMMPTDSLGSMEELI